MQHLARYLARQSGHPEHGDRLAALLSALQNAHDNGDTLIRLDAEQRAAADALATTPLLADDDRTAPLTRRGDRLWINRTYRQEARLAAMIRARLDAVAPPAAANTTPADGLREEQQAAIRLAQTRRLTLINGGPGTGKTYTIARLIRAEQNAAADIRIALAAPTGKAAKRMEESLATAGISGLPAQTLHRLLGIDNNGEAQYHASRPLPHDIIIIDEASMLSLELAHALIAATAADTRLILLGDADQLAAVEPGAILHDLSHHPALQQHRITLHESQRFTADSGIGQLAAILGAGEDCGATLLKALEPCRQPITIANPPTELPPSPRGRVPTQNAAAFCVGPGGGDGGGVCPHTANAETTTEPPPPSQRSAAGEGWGGGSASIPGTSAETTTPASHHDTIPLTTTSAQQLTPPQPSPTGGGSISVAPSPTLTNPPTELLPPSQRSAAGEGWGGGSASIPGTTAETPTSVGRPFMADNKKVGHKCPTYDTIADTQQTAANPPTEHPSPTSQKPPSPCGGGDGGGVCPHTANAETTTEPHPPSQDASASAAGLEQLARSATSICSRSERKGWGGGSANIPGTTSQTPPIRWYPIPDAALYRALIAPYQPYLDLLQSGADPQTLLNAYDQYRILCAGHHGALGTRRINAALRRLHQQKQHEDTGLDYYHGLPLMILANDHRQQLYNGDTGICLDDGNGLQLHLPNHAPVPLARLNRASLADAYALSIHKSQGSEYPHIALTLDDHAERLLSRELLYTGITRSKGRLDLYASETALRTAADTPTRRNTGLAWHLEHST